MSHHVLIIVRYRLVSQLIFIILERLHVFEMWRQIVLESKVALRGTMALNLRAKKPLFFIPLLLQLLHLKTRYCAYIRTLHTILLFWKYQRLKAVSLFARVNEKSKSYHCVTVLKSILFLGTNIRCVLIHILLDKVFIKS